MWSAAAEAPGPQSLPWWPAGLSPAHWLLWEAAPARVSVITMLVAAADVPGIMRKSEHHAKAVIRMGGEVASCVPEKVDELADR